MQLAGLVCTGIVEQHLTGTKLAHDEFRHLADLIFLADVAAVKPGFAGVMQRGKLP